jgi:hypothetical protein
VGKTSIALLVLTLFAWPARSSTCISHTAKIFDPNAETSIVPPIDQKIADLVDPHNYDPKNGWYQWVPAPGSNRRQGFKIHVTASEENALTVASVLLPYLRSRNVEHKISMNRIDFLAGIQKGKFITIYPVDDAHLMNFLKRMAKMLERVPAGTPVPGEAPCKLSPHLFVRYGQFHMADGHLGLVHTVSGERVADTPGQAKPDWVKIPDGLAEIVEFAE